MREAIGFLLCIAGYALWIVRAIAIRRAKPKILERKLRGFKGFYDMISDRIVIAKGLSPAEKPRVLIHELQHRRDSWLWLPWFSVILVLLAFGSKLLYFFAPIWMILYVLLIEHRAIKASGVGSHWGIFGLARKILKKASKD